MQKTLCGSCAKTNSDCPNCIKVSIFRVATNAFLEEYKVNETKPVSFKPASRQNGAAKFERQQRYDSMNNKYYGDNGFQLIRISFSRSKDIRESWKKFYKDGLENDETLREFYGKGSQYP